MKAVTTLLMVIGVIGIIVILALLMGLVLFSLDPPIKSQLRPAQVSADAVESFDQQIDVLKQKIEAAATANEKKEVTLNISEDEINSKVIDLLAHGELPVKEMLINFDEDLCKVYAVYNKPTINAKMGLVAQLVVNKGNIKIVVVDFQLGKLPLPRSVVENVGSVLDVMLRMEGIGDDLSIDITSVTVENEFLVIRGLTRPAK
jgi:uncharacterized protein YpmS